MSFTSVHLANNVNIRDFNYARQVSGGLKVNVDRLLDLNYSLSQVGADVLFGPILDEQYEIDRQRVQGEDFYLGVYMHFSKFAPAVWQSKPKSLLHALDDLQDFMEKGKREQQERNLGKEIDNHPIGGLGSHGPGRICLDESDARELRGGKIIWQE